MRNPYLPALASIVGLATGSLVGVVLSLRWGAVTAATFLAGVNNLDFSCFDPSYGAMFASFVATFLTTGLAFGYLGAIREAR